MSRYNIVLTVDTELLTIMTAISPADIPSAWTDKTKHTLIRTSDECVKVGLQCLGWTPPPADFVVPPIEEISERMRAEQRRIQAEINAGEWI